MPSGISKGKRHKWKRVSARKYRCTVCRLEQVFDWYTDRRSGWPQKYCSRCGKPYESYLAGLEP